MEEPEILRGWDGSLSPVSIRDVITVIRPNILVTFDVNGTNMRFLVKLATAIERYDIFWLKPFSIPYRA